MDCCIDHLRCKRIRHRLSVDLSVFVESYGVMLWSATDGLQKLESVSKRSLKLDEYSQSGQL
jgi:hypothetical protein